MPPKQKLTRESIIDAAFELVRSEGFAALTARRLAERLQVSTSPLFSHFSTMDELIPLIRQKTVSLLLEYQKISRSGRPFFDMGLGYIEFARTEKKLFRELFSDGTGKDLLDTILSSDHLKMMKTDPEVSFFNEDTLKDIHYKMWIFVHGMALQANQEIPRQDAARQEQKLINETGEAVIISALIHNGIILLATPNGKILTSEEEWKVCADELRSKTTENSPEQDK